MRVKLNRNVCPATLSFCERCMGRFLRHPWGYERRCFQEIEEDGSDILTLEMTTGGHSVVLHLDDEDREIAAIEGWAQFVDFAVPMYKEEQKATRN